MKKKQIGALALAVLATFPTLSFLTGCSWIWDPSVKGMPQTW